MDQNILSEFENNSGGLLGNLREYTDDDILRCIKKLPDKMSTGMDGISCSVVKYSSRGFVKPLKIIFNSSL